MNLFTFLSILLLSFSSQATIQGGFDGKQTIKIDRLQGQFIIHCQDRSRNERAFGRGHCDITTLSGGDRQYFTYDLKGVIADEVKLKSTWEDGTTETKTSDFDSRTSTSEDRFNLWIDTLFQDPLLDSGINLLEITFYLDDKIVLTDHLAINVVPGETRQCPNTTEYSDNISDCRTPRSYCYRYIYRNNMCN